MSRLMSVALTEAAVRDGSKTVTRRKGWKFLKRGDQLTLCRKVMGRKVGEPLERIAEVEVVAVHREPLRAISWRDVPREGFPGHSPEWFVRFFTDHMGGDADQIVTRIEWRYLSFLPSSAVRSAVQGTLPVAEDAA